MPASATADDRPPRRDFGDRPQRFNRDDRSAGDFGDRKRDPGPWTGRIFARETMPGGEKRSFKPRAIAEF